jgi:hypothetical protein
LRAGPPQPRPVKAVGISEVVVLISSIEQGDYEITADIAIRGAKMSAGEE